MHITSKGQVTIPLPIREQSGFLPLTEVEFEIIKAGILIKKATGAKSFGKTLIGHMRGRADVKMSTDEIMGLTRE